MMIYTYRTVRAHNNLYHPFPPILFILLNSLALNNFWSLCACRPLNGRVGSRFGLLVPLVELLERVDVVEHCGMTRLSQVSTDGSLKESGHWITDDVYCATRWNDKPDTTANSAPSVCNSLLSIWQECTFYLLHFPLSRFLFRCLSNSLFLRLILRLILPLFILLIDC